MNKEIYLAGGCFWGTQHFLKQIHGVVDTVVGYANSVVPNPTYDQVCRGVTGAAETVRTIYNPHVVSLRFLLRAFFRTIDPTSVNRQGNDCGEQYRTGIFYTDPADRPVIEAELAALGTLHRRPLAVQAAPLTNFYIAEPVHQDYLDHNRGGYCHIGLDLIEWARNAVDHHRHGEADGIYRRPDDAQIRRMLSPLQWAVTQESATEPPFHNAYADEARPGIYVDIVTGQPLFSSADKFHSSCGWPAFSRPLADDLIDTLPDTSHGMVRTEVRSRVGRSHLGHRFPDGPADKGGQRYCINSAALRFIPLDNMAREGYAAYIPAVTGRDA